MIFFGVVVVFTQIANLVASFTTPLTDRARDVLERWFPAHGVDVDNNGEIDFQIPRHPIIYYTKNLLPSFALETVVILFCAGIFTTLEDWDFGTAVYHCIITATTVGYGDISIETEGGRVWACVQIVLSVGLLGEIISSSSSLHDKRVRIFKRNAALTRELDSALLDDLMRRAIAIRPKMLRDGQGLSEMEFVLCMCVELELLTPDELAPFIKRFRALDVDGTGRLGKEDIEAALAMSREQKEHRRSQQFMPPRVWPAPHVTEASSARAIEARMKCDGASRAALDLMDLAGKAARAAAVAAGAKVDAAEAAEKDARERLCASLKQFIPEDTFTAAAEMEEREEAPAAPHSHRYSNKVGFLPLEVEKGKAKVDVNNSAGYRDRVDS
ncbi:hypothetical protein AB1Y20_004202 [Prymnesium parvum]|uniref:EF-hand domain-containing protein n=1 Tax=Prymnesium parvum TaxID=97485 RepID=A0AB34J7H2_PRYPA